MDAKDNKKSKTKGNIKKIIYILIIIFILFIFYNYYIKNTATSSKNVELLQATSSRNIEFSNIKKIDIDSIIQKNSSNDKAEEFREEINVLEYLTQYVTNDELPKGESYVIQEGVNGTQKITYKKIYENGKEIGEEQISSVVEKPAFNKIVEIGGASKRYTHNVKVGDNVYVTADEVTVYSEANDQSEKLTKLRNNDELKIIKIQSDWYYISCGIVNGWVKKESTKYIEDENEQNITNQTTEKSKNQLISGLSFDMKLNKPSGLTLEQFQKVLTDKQDKNNIFKDNAQYFYYIENQYQINGIFVASIAIHESAWGTSKIARDKKNLFGYGAYDSNPYNGAYQFTNYSESIDLLARVLVKYYLNPKGTSIYSGEKALGTYYTKPTLSGVNQKYASDKNWANGVYKYMQYLYNKL